MTIHTYPAAQAKLHALRGTKCQCLPKIEKYSNGNVHVIHNKMVVC